MQSQARNEKRFWQYLQRVFPAHRRFTTGAITDSEGRLSGQVDVVAEYGMVPSFPMPGTEERLILAESVAVAIEVKSDLAAQWDQVRGGTQHIDSSQKKHERNHGLWHARLPNDIMCRVPSIAVGYTGYRTVQALKDRLETTLQPERPDAALVIESGCFVGFGMETSGVGRTLRAVPRRQRDIRESGLRSARIF